MKEIKLLSKLGLPFDLINEIIEIGTFKNVKTSQTLVRVGERISQGYVVLQGGFVINFVDEKVTKTVNFFIPEYNPFMTVYHGYFHNQPSMYEIKSFTNSCVLEFDKKDIERLLASKTDYTKLFYTKVIDSLIANNLIRTMLLTQSSLDIYNHLCQHSPEIIRQVPSKYIADYLGISPQWLSKIKKQANF